MTEASSRLILQTFMVTAVLCAYASGLWAVYKHFVVKGSIDPLMKLTSFLSLGGILWFLLDQYFVYTSATLPRLSGELGCLTLIAAFMGLFWWTVATTRKRRLTLAFSKDQPQFLYTQGSYAWSRHPFYASYIIFWIAAAIGSADSLFWVVPFTMVLLYRLAARAEEAKFAQSPLSGQYDSYKIRTAMLFSFPGMTRYFRQQGIVKNNVQPNGQSRS